MAAQWYYVENDEEVGPVPAAVIKQKVAAGVIGPDDEIWKDGLPDWVPARKVKGLFTAGATGSARTATAAPAPPPAPEPVPEPAPVAEPDEPDDWLDDAPEDGGDPFDLPATTGGRSSSRGGKSRGGKKKSRARASARPLADRLAGGDFVYGGVFKRFVALFLDGLILILPNFALLFLGGFLLDSMGGPGGDPGVGGLIVILVIGAAVLALNVGYNAYFESSPKQATFGKGAMNLIVTDKNGDRISFGRAIGRILSKTIITGNIPFGLGWLMAAFTDQKQALHDMIAGTLVLEE